jgi:hypothetical protein
MAAGIEPTPAILASIRAAFAGLPLTRSADPLASSRAVMAAADRRHAARLAKWERDAPFRKRAMRAYEAANARRQAELGLPPGVRVPVLAALTKPERPEVYL